jgi:hypothetical protein
MRWGIVPWFAKSEDEFKALSTINAKSDNLTSSSKMWREPFAKRRCLVPASGLYEWPMPGHAIASTYEPKSEPAIEEADPEISLVRCRSLPRTGRREPSECDHGQHDRLHGCPLRRPPKPTHSPTPLLFPPSALQLPPIQAASRMLQGRSSLASGHSSDRDVASLDEGQWLWLPPFLCLTFGEMRFSWRDPLRLPSLFFRSSTVCG